MSNGKATVDIYDLACIQENINLYGSEHGKVIPILENRQYVKIDHTEFSYGKFQGKDIENIKVGGSGSCIQQNSCRAPTGCIDLGNIPDHVPGN